MNRDQLQQQVECPICLEQFQTPKQLPCQHSFCLHCLQAVHNNNGGNSVECPECRNQHQIPANGIAGFPTSVAIQRLLEALNQPNVPQLQPSAPPLTVRNTVIPAVTTRNQDREEEDSIAMARAISLVEHQQQLERENLDQQRRDQQVRDQQQRDQLVRDQQQWDQQRRDQQVTDQQRRDQQQRDQQQRAIAGNQDALQISNVLDNTWRITFQNMRHAYQRYLGHLTRNKRPALLIILCIITISRFIAGAVKLGSDCQYEYNVAVYSFVKAWFGFMFYGTLCVLYGTTRLERALKNKFVQIWLVIHALFTVIWFFVGTAWVFGKYAEMQTECPKYIQDWDSHFINFILFLTVVDWIGAVIFVFYSLYYLCDTDDDTNIQ